MKTLAALVLVLLTVIPAHAQKRPEPKPPEPKADARALLRALEDAFTDVADRVTPAVVNVSTVPKRGLPGTGEESPERFREFFGEEFHERYFRRRPREDAGEGGSQLPPEPRQRPQAGTARPANAPSEQPEPDYDDLPF